MRDGVTTAEAQRVKELEPEIKELRRADEILKLTGAFSQGIFTAGSSLKGA